DRRCFWSQRPEQEVTANGARGNPRRGGAGGAGTVEVGSGRAEATQAAIRFRRRCTKWRSPRPPTVLRNSAMVLGSGTPLSGPRGVVGVATWACIVVWPLLTDEGTSSSWSFFTRFSVPVPLGTANVGVEIGSNETCTFDWNGPVTVPLRWPVTVIGGSVTVV